MNTRILAGEAATVFASPRDISMSRSQAIQVKKLKKAASEFESMLISNWWNTMKDSGLPGCEDDTDPGKGTLDQMGINALSAAIANGKGGLGLGQMLIHSLMERMDEAKTRGAASSPSGGTPAT
jgi:Rod binding domain-containing protein